MRRFRIAGILLLGLYACAAEVVDEADVEATTAPLYTVDTGRLWAGGRVKVCFASETTKLPEFPTYRDTFRRMVEERFGRSAKLHFYDWGACPSTGTDFLFIKIQPDPARPGCQTQRNANDPVRIYCGTHYWAGLYAGLMHEFMHGLGFQHEFDHPNATGFCEAGGDIGGTYYTPYDPKSITNSTYCSYVNEDLSPWDVAGLRVAYGKKPVGVLVNSYNACLDIDATGGSTAPSRQTRNAECNGAASQLWVYNATNKTLRDPLIPSTKQYLDVQWGNSADYTPTWNYEYNGGAAQQWTFSGVQIRGTGGSCLDVRQGNFTAGAQLHVWQCDDTNNNQKWNVLPLSNGRFRLQIAASTGLCASRYGKLAACTSADTEFVMSNRQLKNPAGDRCLDVSNGDPNSGSIVQDYACWTNTSDSRRAAQEWNIRGQLRGLGGKCLDTSNGENGTGTFIKTCGSGLRGQIWDFYF